MVRIELAAADSLADMRARSKFGMAIAAIIKMIATTISNSINEKPFCSLPLSGGGRQWTRMPGDALLGKTLLYFEEPLQFPRRVVMLLPKIMTKSLLFN